MPWCKLSPFFTIFGTLFISFMRFSGSVFLAYIGLSRAPAGWAQCPCSREKMRQCSMTYMVQNEVASHITAWFTGCRINNLHLSQRRQCCPRIESRTWRIGRWWRRQWFGLQGRPGKSKTAFERCGPCWPAAGWVGSRGCRPKSKNLSIHLSYISFYNISLVIYS